MSGAETTAHANLKKLACTVQRWKFLDAIEYPLPTSVAQQANSY